MAEQSPTIPGIAVVGCGAWGGNHVRTFQALGALAAIADTNPQNARRASERSGLPVRAFADLLGDPAVAAMVLSTPDATHAGLARAALDAGKHVLVEKPMAMSSEDAADLCARAEARDRILMCGHILHYHPAFRELVRLAGAGTLGGLHHIAAKRLQPTPGAPRHVFWDLAPHDVSMILALAGRMPLCVRAMQSSPVPGAPPQVAQVMLEFGGGLSAEIALSEIHPHKLHQLAVTGETMTAVFEDSRPWPEKLALYPPPSVPRGDPRAGPRPVAVTEDEPLMSENRAFLAAIAGGAAPPSDGREGHAVVTVVEAAAAAAAANEPVFLDSGARAVLETGRVGIA